MNRLLNESKAKRVLATSVMDLHSSCSAVKMLLVDLGSTKAEAEETVNEWVKETVDKIEGLDFSKDLNDLLDKKITFQEFLNNTMERLK